MINYGTEMASTHSSGLQVTDAYYDMENLNKDYSACKMLSCIHINTRSMRNKLDEINELIQSKTEKFDVLFTETWLTANDPVPQFSGYRSHHIRRENKAGAGVAVYVKEPLKLDVIEEFSIITNDVECLTVHLNKTVVSVVYRPPTGDKATFFSFMEKLLPLTRSTSETCVIMGDVNVNMTTDEAWSLELKTLFSCYGCSNYITAPTRVTINSATLLDICVSNLNECDIKSGVLIADLSDHLPVFCLIPKDPDKQNNDCKQRFCQIIRQNTLEQFRCLLQCIDRLARNI